MSANAAAIVRRDDHRPPARNSAGNVKKIAPHSPNSAHRSESGLVTSPAPDVHLSWQQSLRLDRIASDAPDGGPACSELLHDPKPGPTGAADNTVRLVHGSIAFRR